MCTRGHSKLIGQLQVRFKTKESAIDSWIANPELVVDLVFLNPFF